MTEAQLQVDAGRQLILDSRLVRWNKKTLRFMAKSEATFETGNLLHGYRRYEAWILFSVGAEILAKGVCHHHNCLGTVKKKDVTVQLGKDKTPKFAQPPARTNTLDWDTWIANVANDNKGSNPPCQTFWGTLGDLTKGGLAGPLGKPPTGAGFSKDELIAAYRYLAVSIRNRDAHAYVKGERVTNFPSVKDLFIPSLNQLLAFVRHVRTAGA